MKELYFVGTEIKTPPLSNEARREIGFLLRLLQKDMLLSLPHSRPMPSIGKGCHELRINDKNRAWRIIYYIDSEAIVILDVFPKKTIHYRTLFGFSNELHELTRIFVFFRVNSRKFVAILE